MATKDCGEYYEEWKSMFFWFLWPHSFFERVCSAFKQEF